MFAFDELFEVDGFLPCFGIVTNETDLRDGIVVFTGNLLALKRFKDDVKEVSTNFECGISLAGCNDIREGDMIETFREIEVKQKL